MGRDDDFIDPEKLGDWAVREIDTVLSEHIEPPTPLAELPPENKAALGKMMISFLTEKGGFKAGGVKNIRMRSYTHEEGEK